jgi:cyclic pyranopterin phosphate synthase
VREIVQSHFTLTARHRGDRTAETYTINAGPATVGFIASLSEPFCDNCSRMRLTADGNIRPCLFSDYELSVAELLRGGASDEELLQAIRTAVSNKPRGNQYVEAPFGTVREDDRPASSGPFIRTVGG